MMVLKLENLQVRLIRFFITDKKMFLIKTPHICIFMTLTLSAAIFLQPQK